MKVKCLLITAVTLLWVNLGIAAVNTVEEFPGRRSFPAVPFIELDDLYKERDSVLIVDVRSAYEYETLRIKGSVNVNVHSGSFLDDMRKLRSENPNKKIVTYCNGRTCYKSYEAVQHCRNVKIENVVAFDAGILDWATKYPNEAILLGKSPVDTKKLISKDRFHARTLPPKKFEAMVGNSDVIVLDVRDRFQRDASSIFPSIDKRVGLDDKPSLDRYFAKAKKEHKTLLIYDAAGKQVDWLMYYLEDQGVPNYYFMDGGTNAYYKDLRKDFAQ